jgi:hypothetical protein
VRVYTIVFPKRGEMPSALVKNSLLSSVTQEMMSAITSDEFVNKSLASVDLSKFASKVGRDEDLRISCEESLTLPNLITFSRVARADLS